MPCCPIEKHRGLLGKTPLHLTSSQGHLKASQLLLRVPEAATLEILGFRCHGMSWDWSRPLFFLWRRRPFFASRRHEWDCLKWDELFFRSRKLIQLVASTSIPGSVSGICGTLWDFGCRSVMYNIYLWTEILARSQEEIDGDTADNWGQVNLTSTGSWKQRYIDIAWLQERPQHAQVQCVCIYIKLCNYIYICLIKAFISLSLYIYTHSILWA